MKRNRSNGEPPCRESGDGARPSDGQPRAAFEAQWRTANGEALSDYNARIARDGASGDRFRRF
jgi:hypothetical protein